MKLLTLSGTLLVVVTGCASTYNHYAEGTRYPVTYQSFPESATVSCNGVTKGYTPVTVFYDFDPTLMNAGDSLALTDCKAVWMSGVSVAYPRQVNISMNPKGSTLGAERPKGTAGLQKDMAFDYERKAAATREKNALETRQLEAARLKLEKARQEREAAALNHGYPGYGYPGHIQKYDYHKDRWDVFYGPHKVNGAHYSSFEILNYGYAKDTWNVYYLGQKMPAARGSSFEVLGPYYARDTWNIYAGERPIADVSRHTFEILGWGYAKDAWNVYYHGQKIEGANAMTFKVEGEGRASDIRHRYDQGKRL